jgi:hypothetical protein
MKPLRTGRKSEHILWRSVPGLQILLARWISFRGRCYYLVSLTTFSTSVLKFQAQLETAETRSPVLDPVIKARK